MKFQKSFSPDVKLSDLDSGVIVHLSWQYLVPFISVAAGIKHNERVVGITITDDAINIKIEAK